MEKKIDNYYQAYDKRYKQVYEKNILWETTTPTKEIIEVIRKYKIGKNSNILDLGCGEGRDAIYLLKNNYKVTALDYSKTVIDKCNELTNHKYENNFLTFDIIKDNLEKNYNFIYSIAVLHMFISNNHRNKYWKFIKEHLTKEGIALIISMGNGLEEYSSKPEDAFKDTERTAIHTKEKLTIASTSCRIVSWDTLEKEINNNGLRIISKWISTDIPSFDKCMCVIVKKM